MLSYRLLMYIHCKRPFGWLMDTGNFLTLTINKTARQKFQHMSFRNIVLMFPRKKNTLTLMQIVYWRNTLHEIWKYIEVSKCAVSAPDLGSWGPRFESPRVAELSFRLYHNSLHRAFYCHHFIILDMTNNVETNVKCQKVSRICWICPEIGKVLNTTAWQWLSTVTLDAGLL